jgi:hypothetical protein
MHGIGQERETAGDETTDNLGDHEKTGQYKGDP